METIIVYWGNIGIMEKKMGNYYSDRVYIGVIVRHSALFSHPGRLQLSGTLCSSSGNAQGQEDFSAQAALGCLQQRLGSEHAVRAHVGSPLQRNTPLQPHIPKSFPQ